MSNLVAHTTHSLQEHPIFTVKHWLQEVASGEMSEPYWLWVDVNVEIALEQQAEFEDETSYT